MYFVVGILITIVLAWLIYGVLSIAGVDNAGNVAAYTALGICAVSGLALWFRDEVVGSKTCPDCRSDVPAEAAVCKHCRHEFAS